MSKQSSSPTHKPVTLRALAQADEETRVMLAQQWWQENWLYLLGGIVLGAGFVIGIYQWTTHQEARHDLANSLYFELIAQEELAEDLSAIDQYDDTIYPALVRLAYARLSVEDDEPEKAIAHLKWVMENYADDSVAELARVRWLRILLMQKKYQEVLNNVNLYDYESYANFVFDEIRGDAHFGLSDLPKALTAYQSAMDAVTKTAMGENKFLELKINNLKSRL